MGNNVHSTTPENRIISHYSNNYEQRHQSHIELRHCRIIIAQCWHTAWQQQTQLMPTVRSPTVNILQTLCLQCVASFVVPRILGSIKRCTMSVRLSCACPTPLPAINFSMESRRKYRFVPRVNCKWQWHCEVKKCVVVDEQMPLQSSN